MIAEMISVEERHLCELIPSGLGQELSLSRAKHNLISMAVPMFTHQKVKSYAE